MFDEEAFILQLPKVSFGEQSPSWFESIWKYITVYFTDALHRFEGLQLLPVQLQSGSTENLKLEKGKARLLLQGSSCDVADHHVQNCLKTLGVKLVQSVLCRSALSHPNLFENYIQKGNLRGVLNCLSNLPESYFDKMSKFFYRKTSDVDKIAFQKCCSRITSAEALTPVATKLLQKLALFQIESTDGSTTFTSCEQTPVGCREKTLPHREAVVDLSSDQSLTLARSLGMKQINSVELIKDFILPSVKAKKYTDEEVDIIVQYIFNKNLLGESEISSKLKNLEFVPTQSGKRKMSGEMFDPEDNLIKQFLHTNMIPGGDYMPYIHYLKELGLKTSESVTATDVHAFAKDVASKPESAHSLLKLLSQRPDLLHEQVLGKDLGERLKSMRWVPVEEVAPEEYPENLTWLGCQGKLASPTNVVSTDYQYIAGCSAPVLDCSPLDPALVGYYNWDRKPDIDLVVHQLREVSRLCELDSISRYSIGQSTQKIYQHIQSRLHENDVLHSLQEVKCLIWNGEDFLPVEVIVPNPPLSDMKPYIYKMHGDLESFKPLLVKCGMTDTCDLEHVLHLIRNKHSKTNAIVRERTVRDRSLVIDILELLSKQGLPKDALDKLLIPTWTPDDTLQMHEIRDVAYDDRVWKPDFYPDADELIFVHPLVNLKLVKCLRVRTLASQVLNVTELEGYGQGESLTQRISNILEKYPDGMAVPKELIQNADDAEATEIAFLFDERTHSRFRSKLFDGGMAECQGPALFVYNNAKFSKKDFENIIKLGGRTKEELLEKVGRFGLGFNAVYHLTDVPSFISGKYMVVLDPHVTHLNMCIQDPRSPGVRVDIGRKRAAKQFSDQYQPYEGIFGCSVIGAKNDGYVFPGTLFRFPLRTKEQARSSEISQVSYDEKEIKKLLRMLVSNIHTTLLFTQNIRKLSVYRIPSDADSPNSKELLCAVERNLCEVQNKGLSKHFAHDSSPWQILTVAAKQIKNKTVTKIGVAETVSSMTDAAKEFLQLQKTEIKKQNWLICQIIKCDAANDVPSEYAPVGGIAMALGCDGNKYIPKPLNDGRLFCFLPLPQLSGLPVHVNGCFAVSSDRRHIEELCTDDKYSPGGKWNEFLLKDVISKAYVKGLSIVTELRQQPEFDLWPCFSIVSEGWMRLLAASVLQNIATNGSLRLFVKGNRRACLSEIAFLKTDEFIHPHKGYSVHYEDLAKEVMYSVFGSKPLVIDIPESVYNSLHAAGCGREIDARMYTRDRFYSEVFFPNIPKIKSSLRDPLVLIALLSHSDLLDDMIKKSPCIPCSPDGRILKNPTELIHPKGQAAELYTEKDGKFPCVRTIKRLKAQFSFCDGEALRALERTGMPRDTLTWDHICERADTIVDMDTDVGTKRCMGMIQFLSPMLKAPDANALDRLRRTPFLPIMSKPEDYPLPWFHGSQRFCSPSDAFTFDKMYMIGCVAPVIMKDLFSLRYDVKEAFGLIEKEVPCGLLKKQFGCIISNAQNAKTYQEEQAVQQCFNATMKEIEERFVRGEPETKSFVRSKLKGKACILVKAKIVKPEVCAFDSNLSCEPWLNKVAHELELYCGHLLRDIGVKEQFGIEDFITALERMHNKYEKKPMSPTDIAASVKIINSLVHQIGPEAIHPTMDTIFIPDRNGVMCPCSDLCFEFEDWFEAEKDTSFAHPGLSIHGGHVLCKYGIKNPRQYAVKKRSYGLPFGQSEKLTNRIKRILEGYPFDSTILKEMLQNADDAGATELHFILDPRIHPSKKIFDEKWTPLQGPALCVYNDKPFTQADIEGIQNLGEGSKSKDPTKTGQYGVGFNCVYHITDTPTILTHVVETEDVLIAFDPTCQYVPGATTEKPGQIFTDLEFMKAKFPDVFRCYLADVSADFNVSNGTMFRLPLRKMQDEVDDVSSNILSNKEITVDDMKEILKTFETEAAKCLLFLKKVQKISISHVHTDSGKIIRDYWVTSRIPSKEIKRRKNHLAKTKQISADLREKKIRLTDTGHHEVYYSLHLEDKYGLEEHWKVIQAFGFNTSEEIPSEVAAAYATGELGLLPTGGLAGLVRFKKDKKQTFADRAKDSLLSDASNFQQGKEDVKHKSMYCFLPLPIRTNLPVHLNGHFVLDYESRRNLWANSGPGFRSFWNKLIMEKLLAPAYLSLMKALQKQIFQIPDLHQPILIHGENENVLRQKISEYNSFFPKADHTVPYVKDFVDEFYRLTYSANSMVFPVVWKQKPAGKTALEWVGLKADQAKHGVFRHFSIVTKSVSAGQSEDIRHSAETLDVQKLAAILLDCGVRFFETPFYVLSCLDDLNLQVNKSCPEYIFRFLLESDERENSCNLKNLPVSLSKSAIRSIDAVLILLQYCSHISNFPLRLQGLPLLVTVDGILCKFDNDTPVFYTEFSDLIPLQSQKFLHAELLPEIRRVADGHNIDQVKRFDIQAFSEMLKFVLDEKVYKGVKTHVLWNPQGSKVNQTWLSRVWHFLFSYLQESTDRETYGDIATEASEYLCVTKAIQDWNLIPAITPSGQRYLLPMKWPQAAVVYDEAFDTKNQIEAFSKIDSPVLSTEIFMEENTAELLPCYQLLHTLGSHLRDPKSIIFALHRWLHESTKSINLERQHSRELFEYFRNNVDAIEQTDLGKETVRRLPIFKTCKGKLVALSDCKCFMVPDDMPPFNIDILTKKDTIFMYKKSITEKLLLALGCKELSMEEVYCNFIFDHFSSLSEKDRLKHVEHLAKIVKENEDKISRISQMRIRTQNESERLLETMRLQETLLSRLKTVPILKGPDGQFCCVSSFYDPDESVFAAMLSRNNFPPEPYWSENNADSGQRRYLLPFFRKIGLISNVSSEKLLQYATILERFGQDRNQERKHLIEKSKVLLENLYYEQETNSSFFKKIRRVAFVPIADSRNKTANEMLYRQYGRGQTAQDFVSLKGGIFLSDNDKFDLVWATAKLLHNDVKPRSYKFSGETREKWVLDILKISKTISVADVVSNLKTVCVSYHTSLALSKTFNSDAGKTLCRVLEASYNFLKEHQESSQITPLKEVPCIAIEEGKNLIYPAQTAVELEKENEIHPFLYKMPVCLGPYKELLLCLGATEEPTVEQYQNVLTKLHQSSQEEELHPNELESCYKALLWVLIQFETQKGTEEIKDPLHLPNQNKQITLASELFYIDDPSFRGRVEEIKAHLVLDLRQLVEVCDEKHHGILQEILQKGDKAFKIFPESCAPKKLSTVVTEKVLGKRNTLPKSKCQIYFRLEERFHDQYFQHGLKRIIKSSSSDEGSYDALCTFFREIKIRRLEKVETHLEFEGSTIPDSQEGVTCFLDYTTGNAKLYLPKTCHDKEILYSDLASRIAQHFPEIKHVEALAKILSCKPNEIMGILDKLKISECAPDEIYYTLPKLGSHIPIEDHHLLCEGFESFREGEYVGYIIQDTEEEIESVFIHAQVVEVLRENHPNPLNKSCKINVGNNITKEVSILDVYKWNRKPPRTGDVVPFTGPSGGSDADGNDADGGERANQSTNGDKEQTLGEAYDEVTEILGNAWKLGKDKRRKAIKRLIFKWHPDKNIDRKEFCTKVSQYIQSEISRLERGGAPRSKPSDPESRYYEDLYRKYYEHMRKRARRQQEYKEEYDRHWNSRFSGGTHYSRDVPPSYARKNPQPWDAQRWIMQAEWDLKAVPRDQRSRVQASSFPEWSCYKCHQAAEKALKGAQTAVDVNLRGKGTNLVDIAKTLLGSFDDSSVLDWAKDMQSFLGESTRMQYPDNGRIPHSFFTDHMAERAQKLAKKIVKSCKDLVQLKSGMK